MMTHETRKGWRSVATAAIALALSSTLAACSGHGSAANSVIPNQTQSVQRSGAHPNTVTNIYGGGSTLASLLYRQWMDYFGVAMPPNPQGAPSGLPINANYQYYYAGIGSGGGRGSFLAQSPSTIAPQSLPIYCPNGVSTCYPYPKWHYSGSDATFSSTEIGCYDSGCAGVDGYTNITAALPARGQYVQIPTLGTPITLAYNPNGQTIGSHGLQLSRNSYCGIWEGTISNWSDPSITSDNGGHVVSTQPIVRVVRSDSSGTSFLLSNHLFTACQNLSNPNYDWTGGAGSGTPAWPNNTGGTAVLGESGSSGVVTGVTNTAGAIGYVGPSFVAPVVPGGLPTANLQDNHDYFHSPEQFKYHAPSIANTLTALKSTAPPTLTDPYDLATLVPDPTAAGSYPIVGYTWLEAYECYGTLAEATGLKAITKWYAQGGTTGSTPPDQILEAQGLAPLAQNWKTRVRSIANAIVKGPVSNVCTI